MAYIGDIENESSKLLDKMAADWLNNHLASDTIFKISALKGSNLETTLNYMLWRGWIERPLVETDDGNVSSAVTLTRQGQEQAMCTLHRIESQATTE